MTTVHIWPTLAGVIALTPEAFGFSYCKATDQVEKLRNDLLAGVPMDSAVGNFGKCYSLGKLIYVESMQGSTTIDVEASQPYGITRESYTFQLQADREAFLDVLLQILGPTWKRELSKRNVAACRDD